MPQAMTAPAITQHFEGLQERAKRRGSQRAGTADLCLIFGQESRQTPPAQNGGGSFAEFPQIVLLGHAVLDIEITAVATVSGGGPQRLKAAGPITGAPVFALIDKTLNQQHRVWPPSFALRR